MPDLTLSVRLCPVVSEKHFETLSRVAAELDQTVFSCTFSVIDGVGYFDITDESTREDRPPETAMRTRKIYLAVIEALARSLSYGQAAVS
jgi:hypothetical protein